MIVGVLQTWWYFLRCLLKAKWLRERQLQVRDENLIFWSIPTKKFPFMFFRALEQFSKLPLEKHSTPLPLREDVVYGWSPSSLYKRSMHFQVSVFRFSAWKFNEERGQFYYHAFTPEQPDLNYRNPRVVEEMKVSLNSIGCSLWDNVL